MSSEPLDAVQIEKLALEAFARVRGDKKVLAEHQGIGVDLEIVPAGAREEAHGTVLTVRLFVWEQGSVRDIKEQEVVFVPAGADDERIPAYLEGVALGIRALVEGGADVDTLMPHDLVPIRAFHVPSRRTAQEFAACVGETQGGAGGEPDDLSGTEPIAVNRDLEVAIEQDPDRIENHLVYADWLSEKGDPRGELITCSAPDASLAARRRGFAVLAQNERYFCGNLVGNPEYESFIELEWELGWIAGARLYVEYDLTEKVRDFVAKALRGLVGLPSAKFIERLTLGVFDFEGDNDYEALYPILVAGGPRPTMRKLFIGDTTSEEQELSWTSAGDLKAIGGLYPGLRDLKIRAGSMEIDGALDYPKLESLVVESGGMSHESVAAIASASLLELRRLELWLGTANYGGSSNVDHLAPILAGTSLPKLEALALRNCEYADDICRELALAPILERVRVVDLSMGIMTDAGAQALLSQRERFANVGKLDVSRNYLSAAGIEALRGLGAHIELEAGDQKDLAGDYRYVSVGE